MQHPILCKYTDLLTFFIHSVFRCLFNQPFFCHSTMDFGQILDGTLRPAETPMKMRILHQNNYTWMSQIHRKLFVFNSFFWNRQSYHIKHQSINNLDHFFEQHYVKSILTTALIQCSNVFSSYVLIFLISKNTGPKTLHTPTHFPDLVPPISDFSEHSKCMKIGIWVFLSMLRSFLK